jgi:N-formylglutamate amidohydrolase
MNASDAPLPPWVILHIPHAATIIPRDVRERFVVDDAALSREVLRMTDHFTDAIFVGSQVAAEQVVRASVSRLVVDVERFEDDALETMASRGMGAVYCRRRSKSEPLGGAAENLDGLDSDPKGLAVLHGAARAE